MRNLAPGTHRQRMVIEGRRVGHPDEPQMREFSAGLSGALDMRLIHLTTSLAPNEGDGWAATGHWDFSGFAVMAWNGPGGIGFLSVDLHSCRPYDYLVPARFTARYWAMYDVDWEPVLPELGRSRLSRLRPRRGRGRPDLAVGWPPAA